MSRENVELVRRGIEGPWQRTVSSTSSCSTPIEWVLQGTRATSRIEDGMAFEVDSRASTQESSEYASDAHLAGVARAP
jgi:hypothetical protein